ncbi:hypothetical protein [Microcella sp.]|uniref:hypothetical protein n=1 Tax=Microcella sp. TaxID=1913979 RepID=UPI00256A8610|nr:hypothetical protein [Microcella sp.]MBX9471453.1 hypothetical protein [Microcella sp.]
MLSLGGLTSAVLTVVPAQPAAAAAAFDIPPNDFVSASSVTISGSKDAGSTLVIRRDGSVVCTVGDAAAETFTCSGISVPNGVVEFTGDETLADDSVEPMTPLALRVLAAPTIDGAGSTMTTTGRFSGTAEAGADIELSSTGPAGSAAHSCPPALGSGFWSCVVDLPSGSYQVRARQSLASLGPESSAFSGAVTANIDRTPPPRPTITSPSPGTTTLSTVTARGGGERDALLQVFVNGGLACETTVTSSGSWACPLQWPRPGTWNVQALQRDTAGNFSAASARVEVRYERPAAPAPPPPNPAEPDAEPSPDTSPTLPAPAPSLPGPPDAPPAPDPVTSNWGTATGFGGSLPTAAEVIDRGGWLLAPLAGLAYLLLLALPLRWFATHVRPRPLAARLRFTGRNRLGEVEEPPTRTLSPVLVAAATLGGAAIIAALSGGIDAEVRYVRLMAAIGLGLMLLNIVGVLLPARIAGRVARVRVGVRLLPGILLAALVLALGSRFGELQPPLLVGVLIAAAAVLGSSRRARAGVAVAQTSGVAALALLGWAAHDLLTPSTGFWMSLWSETAAAMALGGLGSLLMLLLPIGPLPGRILYAASRPAWAAVALVSASLVGAIFASGPAFPVVALLLLTAAFGAVLVAVTVWVRWVAPVLR